MLNWFKRTPRQVAEDRWLIARTEDQGVSVLFRMRDQTPAGISRPAYPRVVTISWPYDGSTHAGMPLPDVQDTMGELEERLDSLERPSIGYLVVVITGNHRREWVWHVVDDAAFIRGVNETLASVGPYPIEIEINPEDDPQWQTFDVMRSQVRG